MAVNTSIDVVVVVGVIVVIGVIVSMARIPNIPKSSDALEGVNWLTPIPITPITIQMNSPADPTHKTQVGKRFLAPS